MKTVHTLDWNSDRFPDKITTHIQQRGYADCGVACIAMITDVSYERVLASVPPDVYFHGLYVGEIIHAIKKISNREFGYCEVPRLSFTEYFKIRRSFRNEILIVERSGEWDDTTKTHYIYLVDDIAVTLRAIFDPVETKPIKQDDYIRDRHDWKVIGTIHERRRKEGIQDANQNTKRT